MSIPLRDISGEKIASCENLHCRVEPYIILKLKKWTIQRNNLFYNFFIRLRVSGSQTKHCRVFRESYTGLALTQIPQHSIEFGSPVNGLKRVCGITDWGIFNAKIGIELVKFPISKIPHTLLQL